MFTALPAQADADDDLGRAAAVDPPIVLAHQPAAGVRKRGPVLPLHARRAGALLQEAGVVDDGHRLAVPDVVNHVPAHVVEKVIGVPLDPVSISTPAGAGSPSGHGRRRVRVSALAAHAGAAVVVALR